MLNDNFDTFDQGGTWYVSDFAVAASWNQTAWDDTYVLTPPGEVVLTFDGVDSAGKDFTGSELQSNDLFGYGSYEVEMIASAESGVVSSFFLYSDVFFGGARHNEIDIEFLGNDTTKININYYYGNQKLGDNGSIQVDLGFDAAAGMNRYRIDWRPDGISWYANDVLIYEIEEATAPLPIPDEPMKVFMNIWTGGEGLEDWHGPVAADATAQATYSSVEFTPYAPVAPLDGAGAISFAGEDQAYVVNLADGSFAAAARVLAIGDSLTEGWIDVNDPSEVAEDRDGYRNDLFNHILGGDGWIDYVGNLNTGPSDMLDTAHSGLAGEALRNIVHNNDASVADLSVNLATHAPDIVLLMGGTNDFNATNFFSNRFPNLIANLGIAIDQFYAYAGNAEKYLVISTLAPKIRSSTPEEYAYFINEGYSIVDGIEVVGDAGNGSYVPGLRALVEARQAQHPTLILYDNPVGLAGLSTDDVHYTNDSYIAYAQGLYDLLLAEVGQVGGSFATVSGTLPVATDVVGGNAGDRIIGDANDNTIFGGGGVDHLTGGAGADVFGYGAASLDGARDLVTDLARIEGDSVDLSGVADFYGWSAAELATALVLTEDAGGTELAITTPGGLITLAYFENVTQVDLQAAITGAAPDTGDDDNNMALSAPDTDIDASEADTVQIQLVGLDADATATVTVSSGGQDVQQVATADGTLLFDLTSLPAGTVTTSVTATDGGGNSTTLAGPDLTLEEQPAPPPDGPEAPVDGDGAISFAGATQAYVVNLADGSYAAAARVLAIGDSLTEGFMDINDPSEVAEDRDGYRNDLFNHILGGDGWIDYVGNLNTGPSDMLDTAHSGLAGEALRNIVHNNDASVADLSVNLATHAPDIVLLMGGTNDFNATNFFSNRFPNLIANLGIAIDQFYAYAGNAEKYLVISTLAPKIRSSTPEEYAYFINEGYSIVDGIEVVGDAGNGSYVPGLRALVEARQAQHPTLILYDNPVGLAGLSTDDVHYTNDSYIAYAQGLYDLLLAEVGQVGGSFATVSGTLPVATDVVGGNAGDRIIGDANDNTIFGGGGVDHLTGGAGADVFGYGAASLDGARDLVTDLARIEGDSVDLSGVADFYGWSAAELATALVLTEDAGGTELAITTPGGLITLAYFENLSESDLLDAINSDGAGPPLIGTHRRETLNDTDASTFIQGLEGDDTIFGNGGNDTIDGGSGRDRLYGGEGADVFLLTQENIDRYRDEVYDFSVAEGDKVDLSLLAALYGWDSAQTLANISFRDLSNGLRISVSTPDGGFNYLLRDVTEAEFLGGDTLILQAGSADEDNNLLLSAPDLDIDAVEASAVQIDISGLDADASALVTVSSGGQDLSQAITADGALFFDLTSLPAGTVTTSLLATDSEGNTLALDGPELTLAAPPDTSADEDGNLAVTPADTDIDGGESSAVRFTVFGLDADATAVLTISDGSSSVVSDPILSDGDVILDVQGLSDGTLTVSLTATDDDSNMVTVTGADLTLDSTVIVLPQLLGDHRNNRLTDGDDGTEIIGFAGDDRIYANGGDDILDGGAGLDKLYGGAGADTFRFSIETLDGKRDTVREFSTAEGDKLDLSLIADHYGWTASETFDTLALRNLTEGLRITITTPDGSYNLALVEGLTIDEALASDVFLF